MIKNLIFDWSGTLCNDIDLIYETTMRVFERFDAKRISLEEYLKEFEQPHMKFYNRYVKNVSEKEQTKAFLEIMNTIKDKRPALYPPIPETLSLLANKNIGMAILSAAPQREITTVLSEYKLLNFFVCIIAEIHDKRDAILGIIPAIFNREETANVGDLVHDIEAGKNAGIKTIAVCWGYGSREKLLSANPDFLINDLGELKGII